jgi:hypothetical protein
MVKPTFLGSFARLLRVAPSPYSPPKPEIERAPAKRTIEIAERESAFRVGDREGLQLCRRAAKRRAMPIVGLEMWIEDHQDDLAMNETRRERCAIVDAGRYFINSVPAFSN